MLRYATCLNINSIQNDGGSLIITIICPPLFLIWNFTGTLTPGAKYIFQVTACTIEDKCGMAVVELETLPVVTSCILSIDGENSYRVLDMVMKLDTLLLFRSIITNDKGH